ncbi:MAG: DNA-binding response regulator [Bacteroidetes bacterium]|nr:DNA-binding response regulator [Bacteroidota bacterium]
MRVVIIEDEHLSQRYLIYLLSIYYPSFEIVAVIKSVDESIKWLSNNSVDLIFMDITLSDGNCMGILDAIDLNSQIIFTTAYVDVDFLNTRLTDYYLLHKPISEKEFNNTMNSILTNKGLYN